MCAYLAQTWPVTSSRPYRRAVARIEQLCSSELEERSLRTEILAVLRPAIGFDAHVWLLTDPVSTVGHGPHADVPCLPQLPQAIRLKYATTVNRWTSLLRARSPVGRLDDATGGDLRRSQLWQELLQPFGISDIASVVFGDKHGCWGFLDLWRQAGSPFADADAALLADIAAPICRALRQRQAAAFAVARTEQVAFGGPAVVVLNDDLVITSRTTPATQWFRSLLPTPPQQTPIPAAAYNVAAQLLAVESGVDDHRPSARAFVPGHTWVTLRASRLESADPVGGGIAVSIEETPAGPRLDLFARSFGLSPRERELLSHLGRGADTQEIAGDMAISDYTVQDHLKSIFAKTDLPGRGAVITTALGPRVLSTEG